MQIADMPQVEKYDLMAHNLMSWPFEGQKEHLDESMQILADRIEQERPLVIASALFDPRDATETEPEVVLLLQWGIDNPHITAIGLCEFHSPIRLRNLPAEQRLEALESFTRQASETGCRTLFVRGKAGYNRRKLITTTSPEDAVRAARRIARI